VSHIGTAWPFICSIYTQQDASQQPGEDTHSPSKAPTMSTSPELILRAWSVPLVSKTHARQNETLWICKIHTSRVFSQCAGQFHGNHLRGLGVCHACAAALGKLKICFFIFCYNYKLSTQPRHIRIRSTMAVVQEASELESSHKKNARWSQKGNVALIDLLNRLNVHTV